MQGGLVSHPTLFYLFDLNLGADLSIGLSFLVTASDFYLLLIYSLLLFLILFEILYGFTYEIVSALFYIALFNDLWVDATDSRYRNV